MTKILTREWKGMRKILFGIRRNLVYPQQAVAGFLGIQAGITLASRWSCDSDALDARRLLYKARKIAMRYVIADIKSM